MTEQEFDKFIKLIKKIKKPSKWIMVKSWCFFFWHCTILKKDPVNIYLHSVFLSHKKTFTRWKLTANDDNVFYITGVPK